MLWKMAKQTTLTRDPGFTPIYDKEFFEVIFVKDKTPLIPADPLGY
jgi:hypothetical protein